MEERGISISMGYNLSSVLPWFKAVAVVRRPPPHYYHCFDNALHHCHRSLLRTNLHHRNVSHSRYGREALTLRREGSYWCLLSTRDGSCDQYSVLRILFYLLTNFIVIRSVLLLKGSCSRHKCIPFPTTACRSCWLVAVIACAMTVC